MTEWQTNRCTVKCFRKERYKQTRPTDAGMSSNRVDFTCTSLLSVIHILHVLTSVVVVAYRQALCQLNRRSLFPQSRKSRVGRTRFVHTAPFDWTVAAFISARAHDGIFSGQRHVSAGLSEVKGSKFWERSAAGIMP